jgi:hypothetical protein
MSSHTDERIALSFEVEQRDVANEVARILRGAHFGSLVLLEPYAEQSHYEIGDMPDLLDDKERLAHQYSELHRADPDTLLVLTRVEDRRAVIGRQGYVDLVLASAAGSWGPSRSHRVGDQACASVVALHEPESIIGLPTPEVVGDAAATRLRSAAAYFGSPLIDRIFTVTNPAWITV